MNVALIGAGYWGKNLLRDLNNLDVLKSVCEIKDIDNLRLKYPKLRITKDYNEILEDKKINAIVIALPVEHHYEYAKKALEHNKDVFVEKPLSLNIEEGEELVRLAYKRNKILMVGHLMHYHPCIIKIKELLKSKILGKLLYINFSRKNMGIIRKNENVLWSLAPHDISLMLNFTKGLKIKKLECYGKKCISNIYDITDTFIEFDNNLQCTISVNWLYPIKEQKISIVGEKGILVFDDTKKKDKLTYCLNYLDIKNNIINKNFKTINVDITKSPLVLECMHFIDCCLKRKSPITDGYEGLDVLEILNECQMKLNISTNSIVENNAIIGTKTKIWNYSHIMNAIIGNNCTIGDYCFIGDNVIIGNNCKIQNHSSIFDGVEIRDNVFIGPNTTFTNTRIPRANIPVDKKYEKTIVMNNVSIGAGSIIRCGIKLGEYSFIGAGSVVTKDTESFGVYFGNPAHKVGTINKHKEIIYIV